MVFRPQHLASLNPYLEGRPGYKSVRALAWIIATSVSTSKSDNCNYNRDNMKYMSCKQGAKWCKYVKVVVPHVNQLHCTYMYLCEGLSNCSTYR